MAKKKNKETTEPVINVEVKKSKDEYFLDENQQIFEDFIDEGLSVTDFDKVDVNKVTTWFSTGSLLLDAKITNGFRDDMGVFHGGIAGGKVALISGLSSTGKSILAAHLLKSGQTMNAICMYIDTEQAVQKPFFESIGIDFSKSKLIYSTENVVEKNWDAIAKLALKIKESKYPFRPAIVIWDSVASTTTLKELEETLGKGTYGHLAKQMSTGFRKYIKLIQDSNIAIVFTNQLRAKINASLYEEPYYETGGMALPFYSSLSLRLLNPSKADKILNAKGQEIGVKVKLKFKKNRYGPPQAPFDFNLFFGRGIDDDVNIYYFLKDVLKVITKRSDSTTLKIPNIADEKILTKDWKKWYNSDMERKKKIEQYLLDEITIDLNSDEFFDEDDFSNKNIANKIEDDEIMNKINDVIDIRNQQVMDEMMASD